MVRPAAPAIGLNITPLSVESDRSTVGVATPPGFVVVTSIAESTAPVIVVLTSWISMPVPPAATTA